MTFSEQFELLINYFEPSYLLLLATEQLLLQHVLFCDNSVTLWYMYYISFVSNLHCKSLSENIKLDQVCKTQEGPNGALMTSHQFVKNIQKLALKQLVEQLSINQS